MITFPDLPKKTNVSYAMKQLIAFEVQAERARRDFKPQQTVQEEPKEKVVEEKKNGGKAAVKGQVRRCFCALFCLLCYNIMENVKRSFRGHFYIF